MGELTWVGDELLLVGDEQGPPAALGPTFNKVFPRPHQYFFVCLPPSCWHAARTLAWEKSEREEKLRGWMLCLEQKKTIIAITWSRRPNGYGSAAGWLCIRASLITFVASSDWLLYVYVLNLALKLQISQIFTQFYTKLKNLMWKETKKIAWVNVLRFAIVFSLKGQSSTKGYSICCRPPSAAIRGHRRLGARRVDGVHCSLFTYVYTCSLF